MIITPKKISISLLSIILLTCLGFLLGKYSRSEKAEKPVVQSEVTGPKLVERPWGKLGTENSKKKSLFVDEEASKLGAIRGQRTLQFSSREAMDDFLRRASGKIRIMDRIDGLNALRIGFDDSNLLAGLLDGTEQMGMIYPAYTPDPTGGGTVQANAVPLGRNLPAWLGLDAFDPTLGKGIKIAILDTGVVPHPAYGDVKNYILTQAPENFADWNGHGTAAASLIIGNSSTVPGAAPGAELTSWRVASDDGVSDSWTIAKAIYEAVDAGNQIISLSMGSYGDSKVLYDAVQYASTNGAVIVASSGNDGRTQAAYPANYGGVIASTAVDAQNNHLLFSNHATNENGLSAPGWKVASAWPNNQVAQFSGTSASAPILSGTLAAVMSHHNVTAVQAYNIMLNYTNETGTLGYDPQTGAGAPNLGRVFNSTVPNINDSAVASQVITPPTKDSPASVQVNIQNQGTVALTNVPVTIATPSGQYTRIVQTLAPNQVKSFDIPLSNAPFEQGQTVSITTSISTADHQAANNQRTTSWLPVDP